MTERGKRIVRQPATKFANLRKKMDRNKLERKSSGRNESESQRMCGRFTLRTRAEEIALHFVLADVPDLKPRYNIAPTQKVATIRFDPHGAIGSFFASLGLDPFLGRQPSDWQSADQRPI